MSPATEGAAITCGRADTVDTARPAPGDLTRRGLVAALGGAVVSAAVPAALGAPAVLKGGTVEFWTFLNPKDDNARSRAQNMMLDTFKQKYPNITVNITVFPWQTIDQQMTLAVKARRAPDLCRANLALMAQHAAANDLVPLDPWVADWTPAQRDQFVIPWETTVFGGHKMSFFIEARCYPLVYRKDLIKEPPRSWDELGQVGAKLTAPPIYGAGVPLSEKGYATGLYEWMFPTLWGAGGDFFTKDGKAAFAGDAGIKAYQLLYDLVHKYRAMAESVVADDIESITQNVMAGTDAMAFIGTHRLTLMWTGKATNRDNLGIAKIPSFEAGKPSPTFSDGWQAVIPRGAKNPDAAWALMEHICINPESQLTHVKVGGELPPIKSVLDDPWFNTPDGEVFAFAMRYLDESKRTVTFPTTWGALMIKLATAAQQVVSGQKKPADALSEVARDFDSQTG